MALTCEADGCTVDVRLTTLTVQVGTLRRLGFSPTTEQPFVATVCLYHYLMAINGAFAKAGLTALLERALRTPVPIVPPPIAPPKLP